MSIRISYDFSAINFINDTSTTVLIALGLVAGSARFRTTTLLHIIDRSLFLTKGKLHEVSFVELALAFTL